jgi:hypothetical protein
MENDPTDLWLFMTVICHQSASDLEQIPIDRAMNYRKRFMEIVNNLFTEIKDATPNGKAKNILKKLPNPEKVFGWRK